jgi:hypothetical protein
MRLVAIHNLPFYLAFLVHRRSLMRCSGLVRVVLLGVPVMNHTLGLVSGPSSEPIRSIELPGARVSLLFRYGDLDVLVSEIEATGSLPQASLGGGFSWHLVVEGRGLFEQGEHGWEVLPAHWLQLAGTPTYSIVNPGEEQLRFLSVVVGPGQPASPWRPR